MVTALAEAAIPAPGGLDGVLRILRINDGIVVRPAGPLEPVTRSASLSDREHQVLSLVAEGYSNKLIASDLDICERTVKNHLTSVMAKLDANDRTHAVVTAVRLGWLAIYSQAAISALNSASSPCS